VRLSNQQLSFLLRRAKITRKRTRRSLKHKQDPEEVALVRADLETFQKGAILGSWISSTSMRRGSLRRCRPTIVGHPSASD
jgi:hypothetical protein